MTTPEINKFTAEVFDARVTWANWITDRFCHETNKPQ